MKTPMNVFNTAMKKKKKNRKGFSLVELIVVLVIMAILSAALIPSLIGYISKTKEQNCQSECQAAVQAAQTIASGCYADASGTYTFKVGSNSYSVTDVTAPASATNIATLAEVPGTISGVTATDGMITGLVYTSKDGKKTCTYERANMTSVGTYTNGTN